MSGDIKDGILRRIVAHVSLLVQLQISRDEHVSQQACRMKQG
jgi:hypothetical protein